MVRAQARRLLNSPHFKRNILTKLYKSLLSHITAHTFLAKQGFKSQDFQTKALHDLFFGRYLHLLLKRYIHFTLIKVRPTKHVRAVQTLNVLSKSRSSKIKPGLNTQITHLSTDIPNSNLTPNFKTIGIRHS